MFGLDFDGARAERFIDGIGDRLNRPDQLLDVLVDEAHKYEDEVFATGGHGSWPALSAGTVALKGSSRILVDSGDLLAALTTSSDLMGDDASISADVAYAGYLKRGTGRMPARDPAPEPPQSVVNDWAETLLDEIVTGHP
jgi:phage gpG-like protein